MKIMLRVVLVVAILLTIPLIMALFVKDEYSVERSVVINKPAPDVFSYIKILKNQVHYSKWVMMDPNAKMDYTGTDGTEGFVMAWDSQNKNVGKGSQTITKITDGKRLDLAIHFIKPFEGNSDAFFVTDAITPVQTKVTWTFHGNLNYMMKVFHIFMNVDKMIGNDLQTGLDNLKGVLEKP